MSKIPLLMTRPGGTNASFLELIDAEARALIQVVDSPLIRIAPIAPHAKVPPQAQVIFTSMNAVRYAPPAGQRKAFCVGARTTEAARRAGWNATCAGQNADALVKHVVAAAPSGPLVHLSGRHVRGEIAERLTAAELPTHRIVLYDQILLPLSAQADAILRGPVPVVVPLFSPRVAAQFAACCPPSAQLLVAGLSAAVLESLGNMTLLHARVAKEPTATSLAGDIEKLIRWNSLG